MTALLILMIIVLMGLLGPLYGADTRDGRDWQPTSWPVPRH